MEQSPAEVSQHARQDDRARSLDVSPRGGYASFGKAQVRPERSEQS